MKSASFSSSSSASSSTASPSFNSSGSFSSQQERPTSASAAMSNASSSYPHEDGDGEPYERSFWAGIFDDSNMVENLLEGDENMDEEGKPPAITSQEDSMPPSALLDHWNHYSDDMDHSVAAFSPSTMSMSNSASSLAPSLMYPSSMSESDTRLPYMKSDSAYSMASSYSEGKVGQTMTPEHPHRTFTFETQRDGTPFGTHIALIRRKQWHEAYMSFVALAICSALSKPILREDGLLLVGTELNDEQAEGTGAQNRISVVDFRSSDPAQMAAHIAVESEVRDLHWMNGQTAIAAVGKDIQLISIDSAIGNRSCRLQAPIPSVHSDAIRELAMRASSPSYILSGGFDETVVLTDLRNEGDPTASTIVSKFDAHDVVSSLRWSPDESQLSWTTDGGDFQIADARARSSQLQIPLYTYLVGSQTCRASF
ncbi:hypothetical protein FI667_g2181, partial [Globisporangium splendens]